MPSPTHNRSLYINLADERIYRSAFNLTRPLLLQRMRYVEHMLAFLQHAELKTFPLMEQVLRVSCAQEGSFVKTFPLMEQVLRVSCAQEGTFVDSGANEGSWSLVAASYGCKVIAVEPQPHCTQLLQTGVNANAGLGGRVRVVNAFLAATPMSVNFSADGSCRAARQVLPDGKLGASIALQEKGDRHSRKAGQTDGADRIAVRSATLTELLPAHDRVALWHLDVEGAELDVLDSAAALFAARRVDRVMLEFVPVRWERFGVQQEAGLKRARRIFSGWSCARVCDGAPYDFAAPPAYPKRCQPDLFCERGAAVRVRLGLLPPPCRVACNPAGRACSVRCAR